MSRQARDRSGQDSHSSTGVKTERVVGKRNVLEKYEGPPIRKTGENRQTVDHPMGLFALKNRDGTPLFAVKKRKKGKKGKKGKKAQGKK